MIERKEQIKEGASYDLIVLGGGVAGVAAAYTAAKLGMKAAIVEKAVLLGGLATNGQINLFVSMCNGYGKLIDRGLAEEFQKMSVLYGFGDVDPRFRDGRIPEEELRKIEEAGEKIPRYKTRFSMGVFSIQLTDLLVKAGVKIYFDTLFTDVLRNPENPNLADAVIVEHKSGREALFAKMFVDASGDCDLFAKIGAPTKKRGGYYFYSGLETDLERMKTAVEKKNIALAFDDFRAGTVNLHGKGAEEDLAYGLTDATDNEALNRYMADSQVYMLEKWKKTLEEAPEECPRKARDIVFLPGMNQLRTSRRLEGDYTMTEEKDLFRHHADSVCLINDFSKRGSLFEVPLRALTRKDYGNIIAAGRVISTDGFMWDIARVIPPAILTGQAAGVVAAHAIKENCAVSDVDIAALQAELSRENVYIHFEEEDVPARVTVDKNTGEKGEKAAISAVIFDIDGTVLDTEHAYCDAWREACREQGYDLPEECLKRTRAIAKPEAERIFKSYLGEAFDYCKAFDVRTEISERIIAERGASLVKPGVLDTLEYLEDKGILVIAATMTNEEKTNAHLRNAGIPQAFKWIVTSDLVKHGKPDPELFLTAAKKLGVDPSQCVVVEDSYAGIEAAARAGMISVMVPDYLPARDIDRARAKAVLSSLTEFPDFFSKLTE